jgi:hypothetical protein
MDSVTLDLIIKGVLAATQMLADYQAAALAGDQATLDAIHAKAVAQANALAPDGGVPAVAVE